jgi:lysophospholipid acyltransferase (LPLAT)-like uncharacterized protein
VAEPTPELATKPGDARAQKRDEGAFTLRQRLALWAISWAGYLAIRLICSTLKYDVSAEDTSEPLTRLSPPPPLVAPFWHRCVFAATYFFRERGIAVMTSRSFDGEYIARIISKFGFVPVRGSSSRSGARALLGMHKVVNQPGIGAFTIDGPRGPVYVAKPGPVLLSRNTQAPIRCFYVAVSKAWELNSWDHFMIPKPWARAHVRFSAPIEVPADATDEQMKELHQQMQTALERVQAEAEAAVLGEDCAR